MDLSYLIALNPLKIFVSHNHKVQSSLKIIQMKKNYFFAKSFLILAASSLIVTSCMTDTEGPLKESLLTEKALEVTNSEGGENLRKGGFVEYKDSFTNQINPSGTFPNLFLPGYGEGKARSMGNVYSFINQVVTGELTSEGAPVSQFFADDLAAFGVTDLDEKVHSVTVNDAGHALFFESKTNVATPIAPDRVEFEAKLIVLGGTKKFKNATGEGKVTGFYNPVTGRGESTVTALIKLN
ncbi:hypothetical protein SAMN04488519_10611 [Algoriphagus ornithinivorans]|uniref:Uncharacterized protein n=1 Tax=Algoriphagus ornithinivorans TaxID=226506 RepID=A0A1I5GQF6_9BACT|nr:hypothetical protein [Algoriphagus ornithinivorans]SFO38228.1 hypothetical protein SAMN04488519_10611 [Algoriphagus ornithinivorans]